MTLWGTEHSHHSAASHAHFRMNSGPSAAEAFLLEPTPTLRPPLPTQHPHPHPPLEHTHSRVREDLKIWVGAWHLAQVGGDVGCQRPSCPQSLREILRVLQRLVVGHEPRGCESQSLCQMPSEPPGGSAQLSSGLCGHDLGTLNTC